MEARQPAFYVRFEEIPLHVFEIYVSTGFDAKSLNESISYETDRPGFESYGKLVAIRPYFKIY